MITIRVNTDYNAISNFQVTATAAPPSPSGYDSSPLASIAARAVVDESVATTGASLQTVHRAATSGSKVTEGECICSCQHVFELPF
jgi:hypothetical protein